eukprot:113110-Prymnesium_polylepis.1
MSGMREQSLSSPTGSDQTGASSTLVHPAQRLPIGPSWRRGADGFWTCGSRAHPDSGMHVQGATALHLVPIPHALDVCPMGVSPVRNRDLNCCHPW